MEKAKAQPGKLQIKLIDICMNRQRRQKVENNNFNRDK